MTNSKPTKADKKLGACCCNGNLIEVTQTDNPEDLWDWCCTKVYRLNNGEDVWKQINKVHQLALKEQRENLLEAVEDEAMNLNISNEEYAEFIKFLHLLKEKK